MCSMKLNVMMSRPDSIVLTFHLRGMSLLKVSRNEGVTLVSLQFELFLLHASDLRGL